MPTRWFAAEEAQIAVPPGFPANAKFIGPPFQTLSAPYVVGASAITVEHHNRINNNPDGTRKKPWALFRVTGTAAQLTTIAAMPGVQMLPQVALDTALSALTAQQRTALQTWLTNHGIDTSTYTGATLVRRVIRDILTAHDANADEARLRNWP